MINQYLQIPPPCLNNQGPQKPLILNDILSMYSQLILYTSSSIPHIRNQFNFIYILRVYLLLLLFLFCSPSLFSYQKFSLFFPIVLKFFRSFVDKDLLWGNYHICMHENVFHPYLAFLYTQFQVNSDFFLTCLKILFNYLLIYVTLKSLLSLLYYSFVQSLAACMILSIFGVLKFHYNMSRYGFSLFCQLCRLIPTSTE